MKIEEQPIENIESLVNAILEANKYFHGQVWWRGQGKYNWKLQPSIYRKDRGFEYEQNTNFRFMRRAPSRYPNTPKEDELISWLFLMQHHGLPTRLLDWTESPLFGCYFAVENEKFGDEDGALFALSPYILNQQQKEIGNHDIFSANHPISRAAARRAFIRESEDVNYVVGIMPTETHVRVMVQLSVFTIHGSKLILDDLPNNDKFLIKYRISHHAKALLKEQLKFLGVRESGLFPDLDHLAKEAGSLHFNPPPNNELNNEIAQYDKMHISGGSST